jgi:predicted amidophosphoribosyltransferase
MPTVRELAAPYENFMLSPRLGAGVCATCFNLTDGFTECYACTQTEHHLDAVAPISYSVAHEQLHHTLAAYKRVNGTVGRRLTTELAAVLWRYLREHERCVARAAGAAAFDLVTTVPSGDFERDERHPLRRIVADVIVPTRERHERLLRRTDRPAAAHAYAAEKFVATRSIGNKAVLLIDDTWTTGASAQSAACALKRAGSGSVAALVIARHLKRDWRENDARLRRLPRPFDPGTCVHCGLPASLASSPQCQRQ